MEKPTPQTYAYLFNQEAGAAVLAELKQLMYDVPLVADDPHKTYFNLGKREAVMFILNKVKAGTKGA